MGACAAAFRWAQGRPLIGGLLKVLRRHWLEAIAVACLVGLVVGVNPARLLGVFAKVRWQILLLMVPVCLGMYLTRSLGWWVTLRRIGVRISILRAVEVEFAGQVMVFMPTGDLARVALILETGSSGKDAGQLTSTIAFQEILYMTLVGLGVVPRIAQHPDVALLVLFMTIGYAGILVVLTWEPAYLRAVRAVEKIRVLRRFDKDLKRLRPAFLELLEARVLLAVTLCNAAAVALSFLLFFLALEAIGVTGVSFVTAAFILALGHLLSGVSLIPGGAGVFEGLITVLMVANGIPASEGAAAGLLYRGFNDVFMAGVGATLGVILKKTSARGRGEKLDRSRPSSRWRAFASRIGGRSGRGGKQA